MISFLSLSLSLSLSHTHTHTHTHNLLLSFSAFLLDYFKFVCTSKDLCYCALRVVENVLEFHFFNNYWRPCISTKTLYRKAEGFSVDSVPIVKDSSLSAPNPRSYFISSLIFSSDSSESTEIL